MRQRLVKNISFRNGVFQALSVRMKVKSMERQGSVVVVWVGGANEGIGRQCVLNCRQCRSNIPYIIFSLILYEPGTTAHSFRKFEVFGTCRQLEVATCEIPAHHSEEFDEFGSCRQPGSYQNNQMCIKNPCFRMHPTVNFSALTGKNDIKTAMRIELRWRIFQRSKVN